MSTKIRVCKIWREFLTCVLGMILIFFIMGQIVQANEEQSESIEREETQEETLENFESSQITQEETSETLESTQTISEEESENLESTQTETSEEQVRPKELDLGEYLTEMFVGDKQLLIVTILPVNASESEVSYNSSNTEVAIVNGMGRIMALKEGKTKITVTCENVSESFELIVKEVQSTEIGVIELDLGDCPKEIIVGTSQILSVGVIPADATNTDFKYESNNPNVASVNALGRLTGNTLGTAEITVFCGDIRQKFQVTVIKDETKEKVEVTDIEISDYEEELKVDSTLGLSVTVLPKNATDTEVAYKSSDPKIATVNSSGEVKGISPGEVSIFVSAGKITKQARIKVKIATKAIDLNSVYQIMKPNDIFQIKAQVQPSDAPENMTYKSMDTKVAEVSNDGKIKAKSCGNTTIVISNGDLQVSLNIIVNEGSTEVNADVEDDKVNQGNRNSFPDIVSAKEYPLITTEMLKFYYQKEKVLTIKGEDYTIYLDGKDVVNFENELETKLFFKEVENGFMLVVNDEKKLCGKITIDISAKITDEKYLYLYNEEKEKYQSIKTEDISLINVNTAGKYLFTTKKLTGLKINIALIIVGCATVIIGCGVYISVKKKYWFW